MAKIKNGILSGIVGNAVFYESNGQQLVRSKPSLPSKRTRKRKETPAQLMTRLKFKYAFAFIRELKLDCKELYQESVGKGSPFHKAVGRVIKQALIGETPDELNYHFPLLPVTHGSLLFPPEFKKKLLENDEKKEIELTWAKIPGYSNDTLSIVYFFVDPENKRSDVDPINIVSSKIQHTIVQRSEGTYRIDMNELNHKEFLEKYPIYVYVYFRNEQKKVNSDSVFVYGGRRL